MQSPVLSLPQAMQENNKKMRESEYSCQMTERLAKNKNHKYSQGHKRFYNACLFNFTSSNSALEQVVTGYVSLPVISREKGWSRLKKMKS